MTMALVIQKQLNDVLDLDLKISTGDVVTCFARTKKHERCRHPISREKVKMAHRILCEPVIYPELEAGTILRNVEELANLLVVGAVHAHEKPRLAGEWLENVETHIFQCFENSQGREEYPIIGESASSETPNSFEPDIIEIDELPQLAMEIESISLSPHVHEAQPDLSLETLTEELQFRQDDVMEIDNSSDYRQELSSASEDSFEVLTPVQNSEAHGNNTLQELPILIASQIIIFYFYWFCTAFHMEFGTAILQDTEGRSRIRSIFGVKFEFDGTFPSLQFCRSILKTSSVVFTIYTVAKVVLGSSLAYFLLFILVLYRVGAMSSV